MDSFFLLPILVLVAGFVLDRLVGDPRWLPHPIRWMGKAIEVCEPLFRKMFKGEKTAGLFFSITLILGCWLFCVIILKIGFAIHSGVAVVLEILMIFYSLSSRSLAQAAQEIYESLNKGDVDLARNQVAMIVGRDVGSYQEDDIARATVETVAENFVDGVLSPLFFAALGGGPLALAYKMVNTLDSMVGYKNERYLHFGRAAAKIDDGVNFVPARLSVFIIAAAARMLPGKKAAKAMETGLKEGKNHASPNAGFPEAAFAGALEVKLNGPNYYGGQLVEKPFIGVEYTPPKVEHIHLACKLLFNASAVGALGSLVLLFLRVIVF